MNVNEDKKAGSGSESGSDPDPLVTGMDPDPDPLVTGMDPDPDPDPHQNVMDLQHCS